MESFTGVTEVAAQRGSLEGGEGSPPGGVEIISTKEVCNAVGVTGRKGAVHRGFRCEEISNRKGKGTLG